MSGVRPLRGPGKIMVLREEMDRDPLMYALPPKQCLTFHFPFSFVKEGFDQEPNAEKQSTLKQFVGPSLGLLQSRLA